MAEATPNDDLDEGLLDHLVVEFLDHGERAVEFLRSASTLLATAPARVPRLGNTVAYCVREALDSILKSQDVDHGGEWKSASRAVVEAKQRLNAAEGLPGEDRYTALRELYSRIDVMALMHHQEDIHEKRLIATVVNRTGARPLAAGVEPVRAYRDVLRRANSAVHSDMSVEQARRLWGDCLAVLRRLFILPEIRHRELDTLAAVTNPGAEDVARLAALLVSPRHLYYFLSRIPSPAWLDVLAESELLEPPAGQDQWPVFAAVMRLRDEHPAEVAVVLGRLVVRWGSDPQKAWYVARAAADLGEHGRELLLRVLRMHHTVPGIAHLGIFAATHGDPSDPFVETVVDVVINHRAGRRVPHAEPVLRSLANGVTPDNYTGRIRLLCYKLRDIPDEDPNRRYYRFQSSGALDAFPEYPGRALFHVLLQTLLECLRRASPSAGVADLLAVMSPLPDEIADRVRLWLLGHSDTTPPVELIAVVTDAIASRHPTGDDARLVDRVVAECGIGEYIQRWTDALGTPPSVTHVGRALAARQVSPEWRRAHRWSGLLPPSVTAAWTAVFAVLSAADGPPSSAADRTHQQVAAAMFAGSPLSEEEMRAMAPEAAATWIQAWRPAPGVLAIARELGRTLQTVVTADTMSWAATPLTIATLLRHPVYINHYLRGLAEAQSLDGAPVDDLVDLIMLVRTHPWEAVALGRDNFDFDPDWRPAEQASVELIKTMATTNHGFGDRRDEVWDVLRSEVENRDEPAGVDGDTLDPLETAFNRPCTQALRAMLSFLGHEYRLNHTVRPEALDLLASVLALDGRDGAEHRAILAPHMAFLRHIAPEWVDRHQDQLFGSAAPNGLGQATIDLALRWGSPNRWLLQTYPAAVRNAVNREVEHALDHYLIAMLWELPSYSVDKVTGFLASRKLLSTAAETVARLLREDDVPPEPIELAVQFWTSALDRRPAADTLAGFGWFADVTALDTSIWTELTLRTATAARGRLDWGHRVAERAAEQHPPTTATLAILNELVRGLGDDWDRREVTQTAARVLNQAQHLADTAEHKRLHTTLAERGAL